MDQVIKAQWIAALRSGKYKQGKNRLETKRNNTNCCLGVLCNVLELPKIGVSHAGGIEFNYNNERIVHSIPNTLKQELGITLEQVDHLIQMNDSQDRSFDHIAGYIEAML